MCNRDAELKPTRLKHASNTAKTRLRVLILNRLLTVLNNRRFLCFFSVSYLSFLWLVSFVFWKIRHIRKTLNLRFKEWSWNISRNKLLLFLNLITLWLNSWKIMTFYFQYYDFFSQITNYDLKKFFSSQNMPNYYYNVFSPKILQPFWDITFPSKFYIFVKYYVFMRHNKLFVVLQLFTIFSQNITPSLEI